MFVANSSHSHYPSFTYSPLYENTSPKGQEQICPTLPSDQLLLQPTRLIQHSKTFCQFKAMHSPSVGLSWVCNKIKAEKYQHKYVIPRLASKGITSSKIKVIEMEARTSRPTHRIKGRVHTAYLSNTLMLKTARSERVRGPSTVRK